MEGPSARPCARVAPAPGAGCAAPLHPPVRTRARRPPDPTGWQIAPGLAMLCSREAMFDAVTHQVAVALLDHVAEMDAGARFDPLVGRNLALRSTIALWISTAQFTASKLLRPRPAGGCAHRRLSWDQPHDGPERADGR